MEMTKSQSLFVVIVFLCVMASLPVAQAIIEIRNGEVPHIVSLFTHFPFEKNLRTFEDELENRSFAENAVRPAVQYFQYLAGRDAGAKALVGRGEWLFYTPALDYLVGPYINDARITKPAGKAPPVDLDPVPAIVDFRDQLAARGIDLLVVPVPAKEVVYPDMVSLRKPRNPESLSSNTRELMRQLDQHGVNTIDLFAVFTDEANREKDLYLKRDTHWTAWGLRLAAKTIAGRIRQFSWFVDLPRLDYEVRDTLVCRYGDIGEMTQMRNARVVFPPETTLASRVFEKETGKPYRNKKDAKILYLGDSFARIYQTDSPTGAGIISHLAYELSSPLKAIVNNGGASTLVRETLAGKPELLNGVKLVVWEFTERDIRFGMDGWKKLSLAK